MAFELGDDDDDRGLLKIFLSQTEGFLKGLILDREAFAPGLRFIDGADEHLRAALAEVDEGGWFADTQEAIGSVSIEDLRRVGLTGKSLRAKLYVLSYWGARFPGTGILNRILRRILDCINAILDSLLKALPGADVIKELKELVENAIDDLDE